jgi:hypothetical protein
MCRFREQPVRRKNSAQRGEERRRHGRAGDGSVHAVMMKRSVIATIGNVSCDIDLLRDAWLNPGKSTQVAQSRMNSDQCSLSGSRLGISISGATLEAPEFATAEFINETTVECAGAWLRSGGCVGLGHHWQPGGVMQRVADEARRLISLQQPADGAPVPVLNLTAWPDPPLSVDATRENRLEGLIEARQVPPPGIATDALDPSSGPGIFSRIRALTAMRKELVAACQARVCIGGASGTKRAPSARDHRGGAPDMAGREAALHFLCARGASKAMADAILQRPLSSEARELFFTPAPMVQLMKEHSATHPFDESDGPSIDGNGTPSRSAKRSRSTILPVLRAQP